MNKLIEQIDKVINKKGSLKTPAYYIRGLFVDIVNYIDKISNSINDKINTINKKIPNVRNVSDYAQILSITSIGRDEIEDFKKIGYDISYVRIDNMKVTDGVVFYTSGIFRVRVNKFAKLLKKEQYNNDELRDNSVPTRQTDLLSDYYDIPIGTQYATKIILTFNHTTIELPIYDFDHTDTVRINFMTNDGEGYYNGNMIRATYIYPQNTDTTAFVTVPAKTTKMQFMGDGEYGQAHFYLNDLYLNDIYEPDSIGWRTHNFTEMIKNTDNYIMKIVFKKYN